MCLRLDDLVKDVVRSQKVIHFLSLLLTVLLWHWVYQLVQKSQCYHLFFHVQFQKIQCKLFSYLIHKCIFLTQWHDSLRNDFNDEWSHLISNLAQIFSVVKQKTHKLVQHFWQVLINWHLGYQKWRIWYDNCCIKDDIQIILVVILEPFQENFITSFFTKDFVKLQIRQWTCKIKSHQSSKLFFVVLFFENQIICVINDKLYCFHGKLTEIPCHFAWHLNSIRSHFIKLILLIIKTIVSLA